MNQRIPLNIQSKDVLFCIFIIHIIHQTINYNFLCSINATLVFARKIFKKFKSKCYYDEETRGIMGTLITNGRL